MKMEESGSEAYGPFYAFDTRDIPSGKSWDMWGIIRDLQKGVVNADFNGFFDRDPERSVPSQPNIIVAPADGILEIRCDEQLDQHLCIIHLRLTDVHVQRVPISGKVRSVVRMGRGYYYPDDARHLSSVQAVTLIDSAIGVCVVKQITTLITKRVQTYLQPGAEAKIGDRLGRILLGSTVVLALPRKNVKIYAAPMQKVYAGESIIAEFEPSV